MSPGPAARAAVIGLGLALASAPAAACTTPVFLYALQRWEPDPHDIVLFHEGPLKPAEKALADRLSKTTDDLACPANGRVRRVDLAAEPDATMAELWQDQSDAKLPWLVVRSPYRRPDTPIVWSGPLTAEAAAHLVDSPARRKLAERLLALDAAVWVLLESGDKAKDDQAAATLDREITSLAKALQPSAPEPDAPAPAWPDDAFVDEVPPIRFSVLRVSRTDPAERFFVEMLLRSEEDLASYDEPMTFAVFGRGRALYALVGAGINTDRIAERCAFIVNACSCEAKVLNPGFDLLMAADWDALLENRWTGGNVDVLSARPNEPSATAAPEDASYEINGSATAEASPTLMRNSLIGAGVGIAIVAAAAVVLKRRERSFQS